MRKREGERSKKKGEDSGGERVLLSLKLSYLL